MILIKNAIANIKAYKLRVAMAMIWIILGVTSVVVVSSISNGLDKQIKDITKNSKNRNGIINFYPNDYKIVDVALVFQPFSNKEIEAISLVNGVQSISVSDGNDQSMGRFGTEATIDSKKGYVEVAAIKEDSKLNVIYGRGFAYEDENRNVILLSEESAMELFDNPSEAVGTAINLNGNYYEVIGIIAMQEQQNNFFSMRGYGFETSYMPEEIYNNFTGANNDYGEPTPAVNVRVSPGFDKTEVLNNVVARLSEIKGDRDGEYSIQWDENGADELSYIKESIERFTGIITGILLIIGGIGITNVMYMSVVERKREIGIRRAIGAKPRNILLQFIIESAIITSIGGIFGVIIGIITSNYTSSKLPFAVVIDGKACLYAAILAVITGIVFGLIPAFRASRLDPIKAIQG